LKKGVWQGYWKLFLEFRGWRRHGKGLGRLWSGSSIYMNFLGSFLEWVRAYWCSYVHLAGARNIFYSARRTWACMALFHEPAPLFVQRTRLPVCGKKIQCKRYPPCLPIYMPWMVGMCPVNMIQPRMVEAEKQQAQKVTEAACGHARKSSRRLSMACMEGGTVDTVCTEFFPGNLLGVRMATIHDMYTGRARWIQFTPIFFPWDTVTTWAHPAYVNRGETNPKEFCIFTWRLLKFPRKSWRGLPKIFIWIQGRKWGWGFMENNEIGNTRKIFWRPK
jgi:hypothetical protein